MTLMGQLVHYINEIETPDGTPLLDLLAIIKEENANTKCRESFKLESQDARLILDYRHPEYRLIRRCIYENDINENREQGNIIIQRLSDNRYFRHYYDGESNCEIFYHKSKTRVLFTQVFREIDIRINYN